MRITWSGTFPRPSFSTKPRQAWAVKWWTPMLYDYNTSLSFHRALVCFVDLCASCASETMKVGSGSQSDAEEITWHNGSKCFEFRNVLHHLNLVESQVLPRCDEEIWSRLVLHFKMTWQYPTYTDTQWAAEMRIGSYRSTAAQKHSTGTARTYERPFASSHRLWGWDLGWQPHFPLASCLCYIMTLIWPWVEMIKGSNQGA